MLADDILNGGLDLPSLAHRLATHGAVRVNDFLRPAFARQLHQCLLQDVPWSLAYRAAGQSQTIAHQDYAAMTEKRRQALRSAVYNEARAGFAFMYDSYMMIPAYLEQRNPEMLLHAMVEILNCPAMLRLLEQITGDVTVTKLDAQATRYQPGHFLRYHTDQLDNEGRRYAFVLNLTARWEADWGGLLQLLDGRETVIETFSPRFNSLSLFRVPADHCVSMVAAFAGEPRLAITGWLRT